MQYLKEMHERLCAITKGCGTDMHEPDNQDLKAWVVGNHLDNAMGDSITERAVRGNFQEFVVVLERYTEEDGIVREQFNLATLIAVARAAMFEPTASQGGTR